MSNDSTYPNIDQTIARYQEQIQNFGLPCEPFTYENTQGLHFPFEFDKYTLSVYKDDCQFVMLRASYTLADDKKGDRPILLEIANQVTSGCKASTVEITDENDVVFLVEYFVNPDQDISPVLRRILNALQHAAKQFFKNLEEALE